MKPLLQNLAPSATSMIRADHTSVLLTFHKYRIDTATSTKQAIVNSICLALEIHAQLEEEIFYPAMREAGLDTDIVDKSFPEHAEMKRLIGVLQRMEAGSSTYDETLMELMRNVLRHIADEETKLLPDAERVLADRLPELGARMTRRRLELATPRAGEIAVNVVRTNPVGTAMVTAGVLFASVVMVRRLFTRSRADLLPLRT